MARPKATKVSKAKKAIESKPVDPSSLSDVLRAAMIAHKGGSAYGVAKDSGVTQDSVRRFMIGETDLKLSSADKIATALGLRLVKIEKPL